jgi:methionine aminopeptidase
MYNKQVVKTYCGHGIGSLFHTVPNIPHYPKNKAKGIMRPGHIFTIEPMINLGASQDKTWPDNWTAVTADGMRSAQVSSSSTNSSTYTSITCTNITRYQAVLLFLSVKAAQCGSSVLMRASRRVCAVPSARKQ